MAKPDKQPDVIMVAGTDKVPGVESVDAAARQRSQPVCLPPAVSDAASG